MSGLASQGYMVVPNVLTSSEIAGMRAAITETIDRVASALRAPADMSCPNALLEDRIDQVASRDRAYALALFRAVLADAQRDPRIAALVSHPALSAMVQELLLPLKQTGTVIRPRAASPAFSTTRRPWHQDVIRPSNEGCGSVRLACWMPLSEVDDGSGALEVIPGPWQEPLPHEMHDDGVFGIVECNVPKTSRRSIPLKPGDVLILHRYTPHRTTTVEHGKARWAVSMWVKAAES
jgi:ectoine hydroxylase-related dioxygenase (phytanoyl-CoA dioxygenase family)